MCCQRVSNFPENLVMIAPEATSDFLCAILHSFQIISLNYCNTSPIPDDLKNITRGSFCRMQIQRQFQSGMSSSSTRQQCRGHSGRRNWQRYIIFSSNRCQNQFYHKLFTSTSWRIQKKFLQRCYRHNALSYHKCLFIPTLTWKCYFVHTTIDHSYCNFVHDPILHMSKQQRYD